MGRFGGAGHLLVEVLAAPVRSWQAAGSAPSRQEIIRRAVLERFDAARHDERVGEATDRLLERWGDVLDRLGSV